MYRSSEASGDVPPGNSTAAAPSPIDTERLHLRALAPGDAPAIFDYASDPEVARHMIWDAHRSLADAEAYLAEQARAHAAGELLTWGIELAASERPVDMPAGRLIGTISYAKLTPAHARGEIGYVLGRPYWGRGYASEALAAAVRYGFETLQLERIEAFHILENGASGRVMEKVGMTYEGILRSYLKVNGTYRDTKVYSLVRSEWGGSR